MTCPIGSSTYLNMYPANTVVVIGINLNGRNSDGLKTMLEQSPFAQSVQIPATYKIYCHRKMPELSEPIMIRINWKNCP